MADHTSRISDQDGPLVGAARSAESTARQLKVEGQKRIESAVEASRELIQENPMKAILISIGVGALLGYMIGRRR